MAELLCSLLKSAFNQKKKKKERKAEELLQTIRKQRKPCQIVKYNS